MAYSPASIVAICIALPLLALVAVCLRFWVRLRVQPSYIGIDDWLIVGAVILCLGDGGNLAFGAIAGIQGRNYPDEIPEDRANREAKSDYAQVVLEKPLYGMMKLSVLFFFRRIFKRQKAFRMFNNLIIGLVIAWTIAYFFAEVFVCGTHPQVQWSSSSNKQAGCVDQTWLNLTFAITDAIGDVLVIIMPYPCINKLQMNRRQKFGLVGIFLLGTLSTAASIVRLGFISNAARVKFGSGGNKHMAGTPPAVWSSVEAAIGVLAACLPPLGPLIRKTPNPRKASVSIYHRLFTKSSDRNMSGSNFKTDCKISAEHQTYRTEARVPTRPRQRSGEEFDRVMEETAV